jgi:hypothetical protein
VEVGGFGPILRSIFLRINHFYSQIFTILRVDCCPEILGRIRCTHDPRHPCGVSVSREVIFQRGGGSQDFARARAGEALVLVCYRGGRGRNAGTNAPAGWIILYCVLLTCACASNRSTVMLNSAFPIAERSSPPALGITLLKTSPLRYWNTFECQHCTPGM